MKNNTYIKDRLLIDALKKGDLNALNEFYKMHREEFGRWAYKCYGLTDAEVADIYQDAFVILYKNILYGKLENLQASLKTYFFGVGKNLILEKLRCEENHQKKVNAIKMEWYENEEIDIAFQRPSQEEKIIEVVMESLKKLSDSCQHILKLFYFEKKSMKEIAQQLNYENENVVKVQKVRCLKYLKNISESRLNINKE